MEMFTLTNCNSPNKCPFYIFDETHYCQLTKTRMHKLTDPGKCGALKKYQRDYGR